MKSNRFIAVALAATLCTAGFTSCGDDYDDSAIKGQIESLDQRVKTLEEKVKTDIAAVQAAIATLQGNDYVKAVKEVEGGYEITFSKGTVAIIKNGKDGVNGVKGETPVLTAAKDTDGDGMFYWKVNGEWLMDGDNKVPASRTPKFTAAEDTDNKTYWKIDGEWLTDEAGNKVQATADAEPVKFNATVSDDKSSITFTFEDGDDTTSEYTVNIAKGELVITDANDGMLIIGEAATYTVALPEGWMAADLDVVRADVASTGATGVAITRTTTPSWAVTAAKSGAEGATITLTGSNLEAGNVAELTVTFVKTNGERLTGSTFVTAWEKDESEKAINITAVGEVATELTETAPAAHKVYTNINVGGSAVLMNDADWAALKAYPYLETLTISNSTASAVMPANAFENHPALTTVVLTGSTFTAIPASAFAGCTALATFTGVAGITEIGANAFDGCTALTTMNTVTGVTKVGAEAFNGCAQLTGVTFGTLETLGANAFNGCAAWTTVPTLASTLVELSEGVFAGCGFTTVTLANVTTIGKDAFKGCASLVTINFTAATAIKEGAFANTGLKDITFGAVLTAVGEGAFEGVTTGSCDVALKTGSAGDPAGIPANTWLGETWQSVTIS